MNLLEKIRGTSTVYVPDLVEEDEPASPHDAWIDDLPSYTPAPQPVREERVTGC